MLMLQGFSAVVLLILVGEWEDFDAWAWIVLIFGSLCFAVQIFVTVRPCCCARLSINFARC